MFRTSAVIIAAIAAATVMSSAAMASAASSAPAGTRTASSTEHFQEEATSATSATARVIAYGVFTAAGTDTENNNGTDTFRFRGGSFLVTSKFTLMRERLDAATCLLTQTLKDAYRMSRGTGRYAGIKGSGQAIVSDLEILARGAHGSCSTSKAPSAQLLYAVGQGPVTLG
jgi:hypothetical protein